MKTRLITHGVITMVYLAGSALSIAVHALAPTPSTPATALDGAKPAQTVTPPLAAKLADDATTRVKPSDQASATAAQSLEPPAEKNTIFYSEKKQHTLSADQLKKFNNLYLASLPNKADLISPILKAALGEHYDLFTANYRVQSPLVWTGDILAGWGMLPHSGGSSRAEFFIHRNGRILVVITIEAQQYQFGASSLLTNTYIAQELATSAQTH